MAMATLGSGFGSVALAPLATVLLQEYSWTGAMLIMGALMFHNGAVGGLLRPLPKIEINRDENETELIDGNCEKEEPKGCVPSCISSIATKCKESEGYKLLRNPTYLLYCFTVMGLPFFTQLTFLMIPPLAEERGLSRNEAALILSIMGISDMCGRFFHGVLFDLKFVRGRRRALYALLGMMLACVNVCFSLPTTFAGFAAVAICWGLMESGFHGQRATVQSEFVPKSQISKSLGNMIFCQGVGNLLAPTTGGGLILKTIL